MDYRLYQYQTDCLAHISGEPCATDTMIQKFTGRRWVNVDGPYSIGQEQLAKKKMEEFMRNNDN